MPINTTGPDLVITGASIYRYIINNIWRKCPFLQLTSPEPSKLAIELKSGVKLKRMLAKWLFDDHYLRYPCMTQAYHQHQNVAFVLRMSVNLCAQEGEEPRDVVLHFDVRFHRDNIISLSRKNGIWIGSGNYDTNYNMFVPGTIFRIIFEIKDTDVITIYCQGKFHSNFLPKIPLTMAKYIVAWADIDRVTHCYFQFAKAMSGDEAGGPGAFQPQSPRPTMIAGVDIKRCQRQMHKKSAPGSPQLHSSNESSDDEQKPRPKVDGRADRYFYETLMCQQPSDHPKFGSPENMKRRDASLARNKVEYNRKFRDLSDTDKNDSEDYSENLASKNVDSSTVESDDVLQELGLKKRGRRGKFAPFQQVVNFMGKTTRRN